MELGEKKLVELLSLELFDCKSLSFSLPLNSHVKNKLDRVVVLLVAPF
jgi:hypothetical protein